MVIVGYRPKPGRQDDLESAVRDHVEVLRSRGLASARPPLVGRARDGTLVEVFEWRSAEAIERAHHDPHVLALWERFAVCCDYVPVGGLPELAELFSELESLVV
jgi:hypothetical protein